MLASLILPLTLLDVCPPDLNILAHWSNSAARNGSPVLPDIVWRGPAWGSLACDWARANLKNPSKPTFERVLCGPKRSKVIAYGSLVI